MSTPTVQGPVTGGAGRIVLGAPGFDLGTVGYTEEEFFVSGEATSYTSPVPLGTDGRWNDVRAHTSAAYRTRIVVRRPTDHATFGGTVVVEWFNVSGGLDAAPDWTYTHNEIIRTGAAWVGVSAQRAGIEGDGPDGDNSVGSVGSALALKRADAQRYGPLSHPGDDHSYDIFSQVGAAVRSEAATVLGGLVPQIVLAMGESQSAFRLTTYINAVAPTTQVYDGYLVHSRAAIGAPLSTEAAAPVPAPDPTLSRTDLDVPVLVLSAETDLVDARLAYGRARQADSDLVAGWEMAGTAHVDAYNLGIGDTDDGSGAADLALFESMRTPPTSVYFGIIACDAPINTGPHTYVARAALAALATWAREGTPPPPMPRLELTASGDELVRDADGNAVAGIRTPPVDAPIATLSGLGQHGDGFCRLFGTTTPFTAERVAARYRDHAAFVAAWRESVDAAVDAGVILEADAIHLRTVVEGVSFDA